MLGIALPPRSYGPAGRHVCRKAHGGVARAPGPRSFLPAAAACTVAAASRLLLPRQQRLVQPRLGVARQRLAPREVAVRVAAGARLRGGQARAQDFVVHRGAAEQHQEADHLRWWCSTKGRGRAAVGCGCGPLRQLPGGAIHPALGDFGLRSSRPMAGFATLANRAAYA